MSTWTPFWLAVLMMQFWTYFWRFRQCQVNFMPFASTLHSMVAFSSATFSALDNFAASAGVGMNAMPLPSTVAIMPANKVVAKWYMIPPLSGCALLKLLVMQLVPIGIGTRRTTDSVRDDPMHTGHMGIRHKQDWHSFQAVLRSSRSFYWSWAAASTVSPML